MKPKDSALTTYQAAVRRFDAAEESCPHWDMECGPESGHECCNEYWDALEARKRAREAFYKAQSK